MRTLVKLTTLAVAACSLVIVPARAGTVTISATGLSSSPIFVTSGLGSLAVGTELNIGHFYDTSALTSIINAYKAGVTGTGNTLAEAQTDAASKSNLLYTSTVNWLSNASNFKSLPAAANSVSQTGGAAGKFLFASSASRTVNGVSGTYAGATGTMDVTYANFGTGSQLWAWFATGTEIGIFTDSTWVIPSSPSAPLTVGTAALGNVPTEILLGIYTDYAAGSDLISSATIGKTLTVIPEPSSAALLGLALVLIPICKARRKVV